MRGTLGRVGYAVILTFSLAAMAVSSSGWLPAFSPIGKPGQVRTESAPWLVAPLVVPLGLCLVLDGLRWARRALARPLPFPAEVTVVPLVDRTLRAPGHRKGRIGPSRTGLIAVALALLLAAPALHAFLANVLRPSYPSWIAAAETPRSSVEAFDITIDPRAPPRSRDALERVAQLGSALGALPGVRARIDPGLMVLERTPESWSTGELPSGARFDEIVTELNPLLSPFVSRDGKYLRATLWIDTTNERTASHIEKEIQALLERGGGAVQGDAVTGTWQAREGAVTTITIALSLLTWLVLAAFLFRRAEPSPRR